MTASPREPRLLDALALAVTQADETIVGTARDTHGAISRRVRGRGSAPTGARPGLIAGAVYSGIGTGLRAAAAGMRAAAAAGVGPALEDTSAGPGVRAAVNGLYGDRLAAQRSPMAVTTAVRRDRSDVPLNADSLRGAFPEAGPRVVVLLHGLGEDERWWSRPAAEVEHGYPELLCGLGWTPVLVRYNTGLPVRRNGRLVAELIEQLHQAWPVPLERLALVGHSMGGLVAAHAGCVGAQKGMTWASLVTDVVTLGSPHEGAPAARLAARASSALAKTPETAPFGRILDSRSAGITDLEHTPSAGITWLPHARYRLVSASVGRPGSPIGFVLGDLLVRPHSARAHTTAPATVDRVHADDSHHFDLLNHPRVHDALRFWLGE